MVTTSHRSDRMVWLKVAAAAGVALVVLGVGIWYLSTLTVSVLQPRGTIGRQELHLLFISLLLSLVVVVPVFTMFGIIAWRYRASNTKAPYDPSLEGSRKLETIWWLVPSAIILILSVVTWQSTHTLDPFRALASSQKPLEVHVVALDWRWLFVYPEQHIASVNFVQIPVNRPVHFTVTADAPMNSFWIPQLGGQIYAMPGMYTELSLQASQDGDYRGSSANLSGSGFASMHFTARASSQDSFDSWVSSVKASRLSLDSTTYDTLSKPSESGAVVSYGSADDVVFQHVADKYMSNGMMGMQMQ